MRALAVTRAPCSARLPQQDAHLVAVGAEEVALGLVDDVGAEVLADDAVPGLACAHTGHRQLPPSIQKGHRPLLTVHLVEVLSDLVGNHALVFMLLEGSEDHLRETGSASWGKRLLSWPARGPPPACPGSAR